MTNGVTGDKQHRYTIIVPGSPPYKADVAVVNNVMDIQFAWEEDDGVTRFAVVRYPTNVVIIDNECPESAEELKSSLDQFLANIAKEHDDAAQNATKEVKLQCYQ